MSVYRKRKDRENPYVQLHKGFIYDKNLSFKAKGILVYLLSRPDDWQVYESEIIKHSRDGKDSVRNGIKELIEQGYISRSNFRTDNGKFAGYIYDVYEEKQNVLPEREIRSGLSAPGKPSSEKPFSDNPPLLKNKETNQYNELKNDRTNNGASPPDIPFDEIIVYLNTIAEKDYKANARYTKQLITERYEEGFTLEDFKKVIRIKTAEWLDHEQFKQYLRPKTLFGENFETYLQQEKPIKKTDYKKQGSIRTEKLPQWFTESKNGKETVDLTANDEEFQREKAELEAKLRRR
ncbi:conserved phage C-terminal domain-containing protein [Domibacillus iocasae]|uniref:Phage conserved hypothetical protein C-terminal domain-containing protein n=1 Tax=Domibacillus iocasae TaxID=1714016 RepID=A0A1E7DQV3_9BACI|nr:conserved phage C-terminal domain-containing protein [Domibacillus iocasae]OES45385.1 hypothetical protein BA724_05115 [Domibacillus iocasae]